MKEQDFIDAIREKTKDLPIPDSISPDNMKTMLDEQIKKQTDENPGELSEIGRKRRNTRRFAAAACLLLCIAGSFAVYTIMSPREKEEAAETGAAVIATEAQEESFDAAPEDADTETGQEDLVYQTKLSSPKSYDEYYDTLKAAYDSYYDDISSVETKIYTDMVDGGADRAFGEAAGAAEDSAAGIADLAGVAEDSAADNNAAFKQSAQSENTSNIANAKTDGETPDHSDTNIQEQDVDEGDIIKTDGKYIYKLVRDYNSADGDYGNRIFITKAEGGNLTSMSAINLDEAVKHEADKDYITFHEFYIYKDILLGLYTKNQYDANANTTTTTYVVVYDIKDRSNPKVKSTLSQSGSFISSRISDGYLYTISNFTEATLSEKEPYSNYIPTINTKLIECENIYYPDDALMDTTYIITSLPLSSPSDFKDKKAVPTKGGDTYVSDSSIYLYRTLYEEVTKTEIMKISYDKGKLTPGSSAVIAGYLYGSFALSEYDHHLRVVATIPANNISLLRVGVQGDIMPINGGSNQTEVKEDVNALYILDDNMELTGKLTGLAPGEQIYSARFFGNTGYFVTYRNTDPLFSVDLSDPANPVILGQLKIPGFSNYLHFYGDNIMLGLGEETDPETSESKGLKLSMFDISNPENVVEKDKYIIGGSQYSEAQNNHKALMIDPEKNLFGFLFYGYNDNNDFYYYATYTYDQKKGFSETARYRINDGSEYAMDAVRGAYIGDYLYLATNKSLSSYRIGSTEKIAQVYYN